MNKKLIIALLSAIVLVPLLGGSYLLYIFTEIENKYLGSINSREIVEKIDNSNDINEIKAVTKHYFLAKEKALRNNITNFKGFYEALFLLSFINLMFSIVIIKEINSSSNKRL